MSPCFDLYLNSVVQLKTDNIQFLDIQDSLVAMYTKMFCPNQILQAYKILLSEKNLC